MATAAPSLYTSSTSSLSTTPSVDAYKTYMHAGYRMSPRRTGPVVVFAGASDAGKTRLVGCVLRGEPPRHEPEPTIMDEMHDRVNGNTEVTVIDTGGHYDYFQLAAEQLAQCTLAVLVFDASRPNTVHTMAKLAAALAASEGQGDVPLIVCANKIDRVPSSYARTNYLDSHPEVARVVEQVRGSVRTSYYIETRCEGPGPHRSVRQLRDLIAAQLPLV